MPASKPTPSLRFSTRAQIPKPSYLPSALISARATSHVLYHGLIQIYSLFIYFISSRREPSAGLLQHPCAPAHNISYTVITQFYVIQYCYNSEHCYFLVSEIFRTNDEKCKGLLSKHIYIIWSFPLPSLYPPEKCIFGMEVKVTVLTKNRNKSIDL